MIGSLVSFICIVISIIFVLVFQRENTFNVIIAGVVFFISSACFCICLYRWEQRDLSHLIYYLTIVFHDLLFLLLCGMLFGGWMWFICICSFLIMSSIFSTVLDFHEKTEKDIIIERVLPRKTFLED